MIGQKTQALTTQFYEWELLGRGWLFSNKPVELEPPFTPFFGHYIRTAPIVDDGVRHTILSSIAQLFSKKQRVQAEELPEVTYDLFPFVEKSTITTLSLRIPWHAQERSADAEQFLVMLSYCVLPVSFEIIATASAIKLQFVCRSVDAGYIKSQLAAYFKEITVVETEADPEAFLEPGKSFAVIDFGLREEFMRPIKGFKTGTLDPYTGLFSIMEHLTEGQQVIYQVLFNGVLNHWESSIEKSVTNKKGEPFFEDAPEMIPLTKEKLSAPLLSATVRIIALTDSLDDSYALLDKLIFAIATNTSSPANSLTALTDEGYSAIDRATDIAFRQSCRSGMLLNTKELATLVHLPGSSLLSKKVTGSERKTKALPDTATGRTFKLGLNTHNGIEKPASVSTEQRLKHTHVIGSTGTGKSTLLLNMIQQDIAADHGVAVLDPHGDLIDTILSCVPEKRLKDVLLIDPSDSDYPVGFNILQAHSDIEKEVLASDLVASFKRLSTSWGDQMNSVFANAVLAFLESTTGGTLNDIRRFLIEKSFRETVLKTVTDPGVRYYWQKEYPLLKTSSIGPILTRLDAFLRPRLIRNMVAQQKGIDFGKLLDSQKILLVKLPQGLIGTENSYLLGTLVVSKIHQAALARQGRETRPDFFFYIDEFQHFITPSMVHILSGARKYHLGLVLAHQDLQQLQRNDSELLTAVFANAGTRICFRVGEIDAKKLADGFSFFEAKDLQNLGVGEAIVRIERPEFDFSLSTLPFETIEDGIASKEMVINHSRQQYGTPKEQVETMLYESMDAETKEEIPQPGKPPKEAHQPVSGETPQPAKQHESVSPLSERIIQEQEVKKVVENKLDSQHRYLQTLIKKVAESKGFKAVIEMQTPGKKGKVDVSIEGYGVRLACEISVTTDSKWEVHNIQKCLEAGYDAVIVCCVEKKSIALFEQKVKGQFDESAQERILVTEPDGLFTLLDQYNLSPPPTETTFKGYRVKVEYDSVSQDVQNRKRESIAKIVLESLRKMKK